MTRRHKQISTLERLTTRLHARRFSVAVASGLLIGGCGFFVDHLVHSVDRLLASDFYTCVIAAVFTYALLQFEGRRRSQLARRMEIAAEVNHHIRNALTGVVYTAAVRNDPALHAVLKDATARIDWVLNTVLPDGSADLRWPVQAGKWNPSSWDAEKPSAAEEQVVPGDNTEDPPATTARRV